MGDLGFLSIAYLILGAGIAFFTKGITGFGNTLVMASLFSFIIPNRLTTPVDLLFSIPTNLYLVWRNRKSLSVKLAGPLVVIMLLGAIPGTLLLKTGNDRLLKSILGILIVGISLEMLFRNKATKAVKENKAVIMGTGLLSGILAGLYGISALLVSAISRSTNNREAFRANLCLIFLADNLFRLVFYLVAGIITTEVVMIALYIAPAVILGLWAGIKVDKRLNESMVRYATISLLFVSGAVLFLQNAIWAQ